MIKKNTKSIKHLELGGYHHFLFNYLINGKLDELINIRDNFVKKSIFFPISFYNYKGHLNTFEGIVFIRNIQNVLLSKIKAIIGKKSIYYWFHLFRRFILGSYFNNVSPVTIFLYSQMAECAFLKFGNLKVGDELIFLNGENKDEINKIGNGNYVKALKKTGIPEKIFQKIFPPRGIFLGNFGYQELIEFFQVEGLILKYWHNTSCLRRLYKGGELIFNWCDYFVENTDNTKELIENYDERNYKYGGKSTSTGILIDDFNEKGTGGISLLPICNYDYSKESNYHLKNIFNIFGSKNVIIDEKFVPNFIWQPFDFEEYYVKYEFNSTMFKKKYNYSFPCFITIMYLLFWYARFQSNVGNAAISYQHIQRAYSYISSTDSLIDDLFELSKKIRIPSLQNLDLSKEEIAFAIKELTFTPRRRKDINLTTRGPRFLIFTYNNHLVLDYASILPILLTKHHFLKGNLSAKGFLFEKNIKNKFIKKGYHVWFCSKELRQKDGTKKEIDISLYIENILFVFELKCINRSFDFEEGNIKALAFRREKFENALGEIDDKADWLKKNREGLNYKIPKSIDLIIPIVISPFVEYIWSTNPNLWLTKNVPRICTYQEIIKILDQKKYKEIFTKSFTRFI